MPFLSYFITPKGLAEYGPEDFGAAITADNAKVVDVRTKSEFAHGHIDSAIHIPLSDLKNQISNLDRNGKYYLICATGHRSRAAATILLKNGFTNVSHLKGGMFAWNRNNKIKH